MTASNTNTTARPPKALKAHRVSLGAALISFCIYSPVIGDGVEQFTLNLNDTAVTALIETVSKATGKNFVVDPRVRGNVTVISSNPVNADELYNMFLSVLQVHGFSAVPAGTLIKIVPDLAAKRGAVPIRTDNSQMTDQLVSQVIPVINVPAGPLVPVLRPMVPQEGELAVYPASNSLIITDRAANIERLREIIKMIDIPNSNEVDIIQVHRASAAEIVNTLDPFQRLGHDTPDGTGSVQLMADERTNTIMITGNQAARTRIRDLIESFDRPMESGGKTRVVFLNFADAEEIAATLSGLPAGLLTATDKQIPVTPDTPRDTTEPQDTTQDESLRPRRSSEDDPNNPKFVIRADTNTNSLIISAPQADMANLLAIIEQLDIRRPQVLVEAVIAEVTEENIKELGLNFLLDGSAKSGPIGYTNLGGVTGDLTNSINAVGAGGLPSLNSGMAFALGNLASETIDFGLLFRAISSNADNNILSTPTIVTLNNEEAEIVVGSNVPFVTGQQLGANNENPFQTIERRDIGLRLKVKPQINEGDTIKLELEQEVSNVNSTVPDGAADITTSKRAITTTVLVEDGQTLVLGGLIDDQVSEVVEKIPLLGDIPFVGKLFEHKSTKESKKNLMIFLRPVIMRDSKKTQQITATKVKETRTKQLVTSNHTSLLKGLHQQNLPKITLSQSSQTNAETLSEHDKEDPVTPEIVDQNLDSLEWVEMPDGSMTLK